MANILNKIVKNSGIYSLGTILERSVSFFLLPIYTRYLSPADYGKLEILAILANLLTLFFTLGIGTGLIRNLVYHSPIESDKKRVISSAIIFVNFVSLVIVIPLFWGSSFISGLIFNDTSYKIYLIVIFITVFFRASNVIPFQLYRAEMQSIKFTSIHFVRFLIMVLFNIYFVVFLKWKILGILLGNLFGICFTYLVNIFFIKRYLVLNISKKFLKQMIRFGLPMVPGLIVLWGLSYCDRIFIVKFSTYSELGLYSLAFRFALILDVIFRTPFDRNWPPIYFSLAREENAQEKFSKIFSYYLFIGFFLSLVIIVLSKPLILLMANQRFYPAYKVVPILVLAVLVKGISSIIGVGIGISGKSEFTTISITIAFAFNLVLNYILVPLYGMIGAAIATLISLTIMQMVTYFICLRLYPIKYNYKKILKILFIFSLLLFLSQIITLDNMLSGISFGLFLCLLYPMLLYLIHFFDQKDVQKAFKFIRFKREYFLRNV